MANNSLRPCQKSKLPLAPSRLTRKVKGKQTPYTLQTLHCQQTQEGEQGKGANISGVTKLPRWHLPAETWEGSSSGKRQWIPLEEKREGGKRAEKGW